MAEKKIVEKKIVATARTYDVLRRPIISEKAAKLSEANGIAFEIDARATKKDVANAIQAIYNVRPEKVNIVNVKGKTKTFRGRTRGTQASVKKAYVKMPADAKIEMGA